MCFDKRAEERARRFRDAALPLRDDAYKLAYSLMRNRTDAEDAVQECYARALCHFDDWQGITIRPWLFTILRNICYSEITRHRQRYTPTDLCDDEHLLAEQCWQKPQALPDDALIDFQESALIRRLVACLPPQLREAIVLREFNGLSYREIAQRACIPTGTVMSRLARARAALLSEWKAHDAFRVRKNTPNSQAASDAR